MLPLAFFFYLCASQFSFTALLLSQEVYGVFQGTVFLISAKLHVWREEVWATVFHSTTSSGSSSCLAGWPRSTDFMSNEGLKNINPVDPKLHSLQMMLLILLHLCPSLAPSLDFTNKRIRNPILAPEHLRTVCSPNSHEVMTSLRVVRRPATARLNSCIWSPWYASLPWWGPRKSSGYFRVTAASTFFTVSRKS